MFISSCLSLNSLGEAIKKSHKKEEEVQHRNSKRPEFKMWTIMGGGGRGEVVFIFDVVVIFEVIFIFKVVFIFEVFFIGWYYVLLQATFHLPA